MNKTILKILITTAIIYPMNINYSYAKNNQDISLNTKSKNYDVKFVLETKKLSKMTPIKVKLELKDKKGKIIENQKIILDLIMPSMDMPDNFVKMNYKANGIYEAEIMFTMRGEWQINAYLNDNKKYDFYFNLKI